MGADYIPTEDSKCRDWLWNFARHVRLQPSVYMLSDADAETLIKAADEFDRAYQAANTVDTRNPVTVGQKNSVRYLSTQLFRQYAMLLKRNSGISDEAKELLGIRPMKRSRSKVECPTSSPKLAIIAATNMSHTLEYRDSLDLSRRGKPFGAVYLELRVVIGDERAPSPDCPNLVRHCTRTPLSVSFDARDVGKFATYFGRWVSRRGEHGNWSPPASMLVAG